MATAVILELEKREEAIVKNRSGKLIKYKLVIESISCESEYRTV